MPIPERHKVIPQFKLPYIGGANCFAESRSFDFAWSNGCCLFVPRPTIVLDGVKLNGEKFIYTASTGYACIWPEAFRKERSDENRLIFHVGRDKCFHDDYLACCSVTGETPRRSVYQVDVVGHTCHNRKTGEPCKGWEGTARRWCKHLLGLSHWLTFPYEVRPSGLLVWIKREV